jgi:hypothetical protein
VKPPKGATIGAVASKVAKPVHADKDLRHKMHWVIYEQLHNESLCSLDHK